MAVAVRRRKEVVEGARRGLDQRVVNEKELADFMADLTLVHKVQCLVDFSKPLASPS